MSIRDEVIRDAVVAAVERCCGNNSPTSLTIENEEFVLRLSEKAKQHWASIARWMSPPDGSAVTVDEYRWASHADAIFGNGGILSEMLPNYESRTAQLHAARMVQRAFEMGIPATIEAGTGVGKSLMYLLIARAMGKRVIVSTSNKALQQQLYKKDAPFVASIFPSTVAIAQGKGNYVCNMRAASAQVSNPDLAKWLSTTEDGDLESIKFSIQYEEQSAINVNDNCVGIKKCEFADACYLAKAKEKRMNADIVITNHMMLALHQLYPEAQMLPQGLLVVDEAHNLAGYAQNALGKEFKLSGIMQTLTDIEKYGVDAPDCSDFIYAIQNYKKETGRRYEESEIGFNAEDEIEEGYKLADDLVECAGEIWNPEDSPATPEENKRKRMAGAVMGAAANIRAISSPTPDGFVRWIRDRETVFFKPFDVSEFVGEMAGFHRREIAPINHAECTRCHQGLTAKDVHIFHGRAYGPTCIDYVDPLGECEIMPLADWLAMEHPEPDPIIKRRLAVVFTSATLAAPDMSHFMREHGIEFSLKMSANSPFDYTKSKLYIPNGSSPSPKQPEWLEWAQDEMLDLIHATGGGAFLLFTSNNAMMKAYERIGKRMPYTTYIQGDYPKMELIARIKEDGNAVLFATKSFFEGVDISGEALRLVVIDKVPFQPMSPFNNARSAAAKKAGRDAFKTISIPESIIDLKQGVGRLVRNGTDSGVVAILDNRLHQNWARSIVESLPNFERVREIPQMKRDEIELLMAELPF